jgi:hypothetical protein
VLVVVGLGWVGVMTLLTLVNASKKAIDLSKREAAQSGKSESIPRTIAFAGIITVLVFAMVTLGRLLLDGIISFLSQYITL